MYSVVSFASRYNYVLEKNAGSRNGLQYLCIVMLTGLSCRTLQSSRISLSTAPFFYPRKSNGLSSVSLIYIYPKFASLYVSYVSIVSHFERGFRGS